MNNSIIGWGRQAAKVSGFTLTTLSIAISAQASVLEEIVVTAQKREQNLQDVGVSVTAYSGDQMKALGVTNTTEITEQIAGLQMTSFSPNLVIISPQLLCPPFPYHLSQVHPHQHSQKQLHRQQRGPCSGLY